MSLQPEFQIKTVVLDRLVRFHGCLSENAAVSKALHSALELPAPASPTLDAIALQWTGLGRRPTSLHKDGSRYLLFRAAHLIAEKTPHWTHASRPLDDAAELLGKCSGAAALGTGSTYPQADAIRRRHEHLAKIKERPWHAVVSASHTLADEFCFLLFAQSLARLSSDHAQELLQACRQDLSEHCITDFLCVLQYHRTAAVTSLFEGREAWLRLRPIMRSICAHHRPFEGDDERSACIPSTIASLVSLEGHVFINESELVGGARTIQFCEDVDLFQRALPAQIPQPMVLELCHRFHASDDHWAMHRAKMAALRAARQLASEPDSFDHPARRAREQCMRISLQGLMYDLGAHENSYRPFAYCRDKMRDPSALDELEQSLARKGFAECIAWVDAIASVGGWSCPSYWRGAGILEALSALDRCHTQPSFAEFSWVALALYDAQMEDPAEDTDEQVTLQSLYLGAVFSLFFSTPGLGLSESHAANTTLVRAWLSPCRSGQKRLSVDDLAKRMSAARHFGLSLQAQPESRAHAYAVLGAAERPDGIDPQTRDHMAALIRALDAKGRRLLYFLVREDRRLAHPSQTARLCGLLNGGFSSQKARALEASNPEPAQFARRRTSVRRTADVGPSHQALQALQAADQAPILCLLPFAQRTAPQANLGARAEPRRRHEATRRERHKGPPAA